MSRFNMIATLTVASPLALPTDFQVTLTLGDNSGQFSLWSLQANDIYFSNGTPQGYPTVLKYTVVSVDDISDPMNILVTVRQTYPDPNVQVYDPQPEGVVGSPNESGIIQLPDLASSGLTSDFLNAIRNYQLDLLNQVALTLGSGVIAPITGGTGGTSNRIYHAPYTGTFDGFNTTIATNDNFVANSTVVSVNGQRMILNRDYTETSPNLVNFLFTPLSDDLVIVDLTKA
jgi:hypothetical protein